MASLNVAPPITAPTNSPLAISVTNVTESRQIEQKALPHQTLTPHRRTDIDTDVDILDTDVDILAVDRKLFSCSGSDQESFFHDLLEYHKSEDVV